MTILRPLACSALLIMAACSRPTPIRLVSFQGALDPHLAMAIGAFRDEGLVQVEITQVPGTAKAMEALVGGSADVVLGTYEQIVQMEARGKKIEAVAVLDTCHCLALVTLRKDVQKVEDLAGKAIGVAAPGGQMQNFARFLLAGREASYAAIGVGPAAVAALESGKVDAGVVLYSSYLALKERHPELHVLAETFTREGMRNVFGVDAYPSKSVLAEQSWIAAHPRDAEALRRAFARTTAWMKSHSPEEVLDKIPEAVRGPSRELDLTLLRLLVPLASDDGRIAPESVAALRRVLSGQ